MPMLPIQPPLVPGTGYFAQNSAPTGAGTARAKVEPDDEPQLEWDLNHFWETD